MEDEHPDLRPRLAAAFSRLGGGDVGALETLWDACADRLYGLALWRCGREAEAADAVQSAWIRLARAARRGELDSVRDPLAYLLAVVRRAAVDQVRARRNHADVDDQLLEADPSTPHRRLDAERAAGALRLLPAAQREAVYLRCYADLTFREIGEVTGVSTHTAASRYRLGLEKLRCLLASPSATTIDRDTETHAGGANRRSPMGAES